ncbi:MAG TPA: toprim domain-containing protein [Nakamurella sp.]
MYRALDDQGRQPRLRGTHIQARCPLHEDAIPSLSVDWKPDRGGITLLSCHSASCPADPSDSERGILDAIGLGLVDRFDTPLPDTPRRTSRSRRSPPRRSAAPTGNRLGPLPKRLLPGPEPITTDWVQVRVYDWVDEQDQLLMQSIRLERDEHGVTRKTFSQRHQDPETGRWVNTASARRVVRHLPRVREAIEQGLPVWLCEGEKDDEAVNQRLGAAGIATTHSNGAGGFDDTVIEQLRGARLVLAVDRDLAGYRRAVELAERLSGVVASLRMVLGAVEADKSDAADHFAAALGFDDFIDLTVEQARTLAAAADAAKHAELAEMEADRALRAEDEARARLDRSREAAGRKAVKLAEDEARYALRWAHEAVRHAKRAGDACYEAAGLAATAAERVAAHGQPPGGIDRYADAVGRAEDAQARAQRIAEATWDACGAPMPEAIREVLLRAVPTRQAPAQARAEPEPVDDNVVVFPGGGGGEGRRPGSPVQWREFERLPTGAIIERRYDKDGNQRLVGVLGLDVRVLRVEQLEPVDDDADPDDPAAPMLPGERVIASYVVGYSHPTTGELITLRVSADRARSGEWLADLPVMGMRYESSPRGRAKVWDAIRETSPQAEVVTMYRSTGWHHLGEEQGWAYIHSGGGITKAGNVPLAVRLPGAIAQVDLPDPVTDADAVRALFDRDSRALMTQLPSRVGAVLAGTAYRAVLGWLGSPTMVFGERGSYKSASAALAMHHFGTKWDRQSPTASMSGNGSTFNAIRDELWAAKDALVFCDDWAPDKGVDAAASLASQFARMQYNRERRDRLNGKTKEVDTGKRSRCTVLGTSEVKASTTSGNERLNVLDLARGEISLERVLTLDTMSSRRGRAQVMASLLTWMAGDLDGLKEWARQRADVIAHRRREAGAPDRVAEPLAELEVGWELMTRYLTSVGAYTEAEADALLEQVRESLTEAGDRSQDPDSPTSTGERCRQFIGAALRKGSIHVTYPGGVVPEYPEALQYGHRVDTRSTGKGVGGFEPVRCQPLGEWAGVVVDTTHGRRLHVEPSTIVSTILTAVARAGEQMPVTRTVIQRELATIGVLRTCVEANRSTGRLETRYTVPVPDPLGGDKQHRMWDLAADKILFEPESSPPPVAPDPEPTPPEPDNTSAADVGPAVSTEDEAMREVTDTTQFKTIEGTGPCVACGEPAGMLVDGVLIHLLCWKRSDPGARPGSVDTSTAAPCLGCGQPTTTRFGGRALHPECDIPSTPAVAPTPPATVPESARRPAGAGSAPAPARTTPRRTTARADSPWAYSAVVIDPDGIYLPDGTVVAPEPITSIADAAAIGERFRIGHPTGPGLLVLTQAMVERLGLVADEALITAPMPDGEPVTNEEIPTRIQAFLAEQASFLSNDQGWEAAGRLGPWTRIRREKRVFRLVLEPYVWIWDRREESPTPFLNLPDPAIDAIACWQELARRLQRLGELLGIPWSTSPATTGEALFSQIQWVRERDMKRRHERGDRDEQKDARVLTDAVPLPLSQLGSRQRQLEGEYLYHPLVARDVLAEAAVLQTYDRRGSYLSAAGGIDLGYGPLERLDAATAVAAVTAAQAPKVKMPFGMWRITLPKWDEAGPPPHPDQHPFEPVTLWVTTPTLVLLLEDRDTGGAAYRLDELELTEAYVHRYQARLLEPWYTRIRDALLAARDEGDDAVARAIKGVYTGYIGRLGSGLTLRSQRPWHHQPMWEAAIRASARSALWRVVTKHRAVTGRVPIAVDHDEVGYLDTETNPKVNAPAADNGRLGALKSAGYLQLTAELRRTAARGDSLLDKSLRRTTLTAGSDPADVEG